MAIYKGAAYASQVTGTGSRFFAVSLGAGDADPATLEDSATWDLAVTADGALRAYFTQATTGLTPPGAPNSVIITLYEADSDTILDQVTLNPGGGNFSVDMWATDTGASGGLPVIGDYRLHIRAVRTDLTAYDVNSDTQAKSGFVRINPSAVTVQAWHNGITDPASWGDDIEVNIDLSHGYNLNRAHRQFDIEVRNSTTETLYATQRTTGTDPKNAFVRVDDRFPAAAVGAFIDALAVVVPSTIAPTSEPTATWMTFPATTADRVDGGKVRKGPIPVDASVNVDHHLQINDNEPAIAKDVTPKQRLVSDLGFVGFRLANARDEGLNGLEVREVLRDGQGLVQPAIDRIITTGPFLGENGWSPSLAAWDTALPGGVWFHEVSIQTTTADQSEVNGTESFALLSINPNLQVVVAGGHPDAAIQDRHWHPGDTLLIGCAIYDAAHKHLEPVDTDKPPTVVIGRFHTAFGQAQYLTADYTWVHLSGSASAYDHPLSQSPGDPRVWLTQLPPAVTSGFSNATLFFVATLHVAGTPYNGIGNLDAPGAENPHNAADPVQAYAIDPIAFALHGIVSQR